MFRRRKYSVWNNDKKNIEIFLAVNKITKQIYIRLVGEYGYIYIFGLKHVKHNVIWNAGITGVTKVTYVSLYVVHGYCKDSRDMTWYQTPIALKLCCVIRHPCGHPCGGIQEEISMYAPEYMVPKNEINLHP